MTTEATPATEPAKPAKQITFRASGSDSSRAYGDTPRQAAERYFARYPSKRKCSVIEGELNDGFFTVVLSRLVRCQSWDDVTKATLATLPAEVAK